MATISATRNLLLYLRFFSVCSPIAARLCCAARAVQVGLRWFDAGYHKITNPWMDAAVALAALTAPWQSRLAACPSRLTGIAALRSRSWIWKCTPEPVVGRRGWR